MEEEMLRIQKEKGQGLVEFALILVILGIVGYAGFVLLGDVVGDCLKAIFQNPASCKPPF